MGGNKGQKIEVANNQTEERRGHFIIKVIKVQWGKRNRGRDNYEVVLLSWDRGAAQDKCGTTTNDRETNRVEVKLMRRKGN